MRRVAPASFAQQRLWFLDQLEPGTPAYNLPRVLRVSGPLDTDALVRAIHALADRHDSLRTVFAADEGGPQQVILSESTAGLELLDLTARPPESRETEALRVAVEDATRAFDLTQGPLWRIRLVKVGPEHHLLILVMHHIITDGWSMAVVVRELAELYEAFSRGQEPQLTALAMRYSDYAQWQRERVAGDRLAEQLMYWKKKLADAEWLLDFPYDHPRPGTHSGLGRSHRFDLDATTVDELKALARRENATLFMVLLAALYALLWRYTSQDSILVGTPTAGRTELEFDGIVGFFVNTLVLRADFAEDPTFRQLLAQVRSNTLEALAHADAPFEKLVEALGPERTPNLTPLFQVMLILQNAPRSRFELPGLLVEELEFDSGIAKFDLTLEIIELDNVHCTLEYNSDLFEPGTIEQLVTHFKRLLTGFLHGADERISRFSILSATDRERLRAWNDTTAEYPRDQCIHTAFEEQAARTPDATAIVLDAREVSYRELNERANKLAHRLIGLGVMPGSLVGISMDRSIEMVAGLLAILKTGAAYVPLDPSYPKGRLDYMLEDSRLQWVVTDAANPSHLAPQPQVVIIDAHDPAGEDRVENPGVGVSAASCAYVIYTSGSTGVPKGARGTHRASMNRFSWMWRAYPFESSDTCCVKTALGFVDSVWEIFGPLVRGVRIVLVPEQVLLNSARLVGLLSEQGVTRIVLVPSLLRTLLDEVDDLRRALPALKLWSSSGESLSIELVRRFREALPDATLLNIYGCSEVAADVTWHEVTGHESHRSVPIGRPVQNVQAFILDRHLAMVPIGARGEIHVAGDCLALGYLRRPELTAERFIGNPYSIDKPALMYKTGDLGRYLPTGDIEYLGRTDAQVKIRGVRVELGEIERHLIALPQVQDAVVMISHRVADSQHLVAYVLVGDVNAVVAGDLRRALRSTLPESMIPSQFVVLDAFPKLPSGKVDRRALSTMKPALEHEYVAPRTDEEAQLVEIWREVLSLDRVGIDDNFFELGGHSLMAIRVAARIRRTFQLEISVRSLFEQPTIGGLACELVKARANGETVQGPPLLRRKDSPQAVSKEDILAQLKHLSTDELQDVLNRMLEDKRPRPQERR
jgi:amino acid adenylation domain-containing protein